MSVVQAVKITLYAPQAHSLKDKRQILRSLTDQVKHRFNVSIAELEDMDLHQKLVIGIACISNSGQQVSRSLDEVVHYIELHADAEIVDVEQIADITG